MSPADEKTKASGHAATSKSEAAKKAPAAEPEAEDAGEDEGGEPQRRKMELDVEIKDAGPCKKHVRVRVPRAEIDRFYEETVKTLTERTAIPGFRPGHVPQKLVEKRFRTELSSDVKQRVLVESMEQLSENKELDPINEPDLDVEAIELPEEGDFEYEFDIEVRPEFELPNYDGLTIKRPVREVTDADVEKHYEKLSVAIRPAGSARGGRSSRATWSASRSRPSATGENCSPWRMRRCACGRCFALPTPS